MDSNRGVRSYELAGNAVKPVKSCVVWRSYSELKVASLLVLSVTKRGQIYFRKSVVQLQVWLGQSHKVIGTLFGHIQKA
jgi:hypothetical protein